MKKQSKSLEDFLDYMKENKYFFNKTKRIKSLKSLLKGTNMRNRKNITGKITYLLDDYKENSELMTYGEGNILKLTTDNFILTNYHVVNKLDFKKKINKRYLVTFNNKNYLLDPKCKIFLPEHDLALLRLLSSDWEGCPIVNLSKKSPHVGMKVNILSDKNINGEIEFIGDFASKDKYLNKDVALTNRIGCSGDSGSPVFSNNKLVGTISITHTPKYIRDEHPYLGRLKPWHGYLGFIKSKYIHKLINKAIDELGE